MILSDLKGENESLVHISSFIFLLGENFENELLFFIASLLLFLFSYKCSTDCLELSFICAYRLSFSSIKSFG